MPLFSMSIFMIFAILVDILNDIFPGYNVQADVNRKEEEMAIKEELIEMNDAKDKINLFLQDSKQSVIEDEKD